MPQGAVNSQATCFCTCEPPPPQDTVSQESVSFCSGPWVCLGDPQSKDRTWEARESLAGEPQAYMLTRAEKAEKRALREHLALGLSQCLLGLRYLWPD